MIFNIWEDCPKRSLPDILSFIVDNRGKTVPTSESGHILIATNCIRNERLYPLYESIRYLTEDTYQTWFRSHPLPGDILFVCKGTPGRVCLVPDPVDFCIAQDMVALRCNSKIIYNKYLFAVLRSSLIQSQITNTSVGDVIPHFKKSFFDQLLIPIPEMKIQRLIGDYYFDFSNKIEMNIKINKNLEEHLSLMYHHLFDKEHQNIELGTVIETSSGGTPSRKKSEYYENAAVCWVKSKELLSTYIIDTEEHINNLAINKSSAKLLPSHSILIAMYGATVGAYGIISKPMTCNQAVCALLENEKYPYTYLYQFAKESQQVIVNMAVGSAQQNVSQVLIKQLKIHSDINLIQQFNDFALPIHRQIESIITENKILCNLKDSLLPKLFSGELDVSDVDI